MEQISVLNQRLIDHFGMDSDTGRPIFRITWANDETEMRRVECTDDGVQLLYPVVCLVKKYPYIKDSYVLERLVVIPEVNQDDLPTSKLSYEPIWTYQNARGEPLPPIWDATKLIVDTLYAALGKHSLRKYIDSEENTTPEGREQKITKLQDELFGNETDTADALRYHEGVTVPSNYNKESE